MTLKHCPLVRVGPHLERRGEGVRVCLLESSVEHVSFNFKVNFITKLLYFVWYPKRDLWRRRDLLSINHFISFQGHWPGARSPLVVYVHWLCLHSTYCSSAAVCVEYEYRLYSTSTLRVRKNTRPDLTDCTALNSTHELPKQVWAVPVAHMKWVFTACQAQYS